MAFFARHQTKLDFVASGRARSSTSARTFHSLMGAVRAGFFVFEYSDTNTGSSPDTQQLIGAVTIPFNAGDNRARMVIHGSFTSNYTYNSTASLIPANRLFRVLVSRPEEVISLMADSTSCLGGAGSGSVFNGVLQIPILPNLQIIRIVNGADANAYALVTGFIGAFPGKLNTFDIDCFGTTVVTSIQHPFPKSLKKLKLGCGSSTLAADVPRLIAACTDLDEILFTAEQWTDSSPTSTRSTPLTGVLDISHITTWKRLILNGTGLTDVTYVLTDPNITRLKARGLTGIPASKLLALANVLLSSNAGEYLIINSCGKTFSRAFVDADFKSTLVYFAIHSNNITGDITLTTARPGITSFLVGNRSTAGTSSNKNTVKNMDISGLTGVTELDISNSKIENLTLPVNTVLTDLFIGGNKLDTTVNVNLMDQIRAMTSLVVVGFNSGNGQSTGIDAGQDSANGLGVVNLSTLTALKSLFMNSCKATGTLTIPSSIAYLALTDNNLTSIAGTGALNFLRGIWTESGNASFTFDFTRAPAIDMIRLIGTSVTMIDLSGRTSTVVLGGSSLNSSQLGTMSAGFIVNNNPLLTEVRFPANAANALIASNTNFINLRNNPALATMTNLDKLNYNDLTISQPRQFIVDGCALNIDLKVGINNWLPASIQCQNNGMSQAIVDLNIDNIYQNRDKWATTTVSKTLNIAGTNSAPSGTYQAPSGPGGTPASAKEKIHVLVNSYAWTIAYNP